MARPMVDGQSLVRWQIHWLRVLAWYLRRAPDHPGRWRLVRHGVRLAPLLCADRHSRVIRVREGFRLQVDGSSQTARIAYVTGEYEGEAVRLLQQRLQPGDVMIDVGANIGYFTLAAARAVGSGGQVIAFEPVPGTRRLLQENLRLNGLTNVSVRTEALGATRDERLLYLSAKQDSGLASVRPMANASTVAVHQIRFDDLWPAEQRVAFVKIDVEGAELSTLRGMEALLDRDHPDVIVEVTDRFLRELGDSAAALLAFMRARGYEGFRIEHESSLRPLQSPADLAACPPQFNALFSTARSS